MTTLTLFVVIALSTGVLTAAYLAPFFADVLEDARMRRKLRKIGSGGGGLGPF